MEEMMKEFGIVMELIEDNREAFTGLSETGFLSLIGMMVDAYKVEHLDFDGADGLRRLAIVNEQVNEEMGLTGA